ncbi:hypothetical protein GGI15_000707 [Coemansia interrupta]|uniref:Ubinuclein middle domain-containing protein n=1 Tax=Coemansia interrupta TaxID=1126814 RepID=A0A9W8HMQ1_9FUNG|nr:hypothetical protein GGI15_000707 [Coemansia interrupta]
MDIPSRTQAEVREKKWTASIPLRQGECTIIDWVSNAATQDGGEDDNDEQGLDEASNSDDYLSDGGEGYASGTTALPPAIANDPFFANLLRNAELRDAEDKKKAAKKRQIKRRPKDAVEDNYDLEDPFIDDSELTFMDGHNHTKTQQRKKRRKRDDGNATETEGQGTGDAKTGDDADDKQRNGASADAPGNAQDSIPQDEDPDRYSAEDFFVYFGPLNEMPVGGAEEDEFAAPAKRSRSRKQPEKKQNAAASGGGATTTSAAGPKDNAQVRRRANGADGSKADVPETAGKKKTDGKGQQPQQLPNTTLATSNTTQHRRNGSGDSTTASQIPSNGRKSGARTSRKLDQNLKNATSSTLADSKTSTAADASSKRWRPPVPGRDKKTFVEQPQQQKPDSRPDIEGGGNDTTSSAYLAPHPTTAASSSRSGNRQGGTPSASAVSEAQMPTPEIEAALEELKQVTKSESFKNRHRFPSSLKPSLRQVCELSMVRALEYDSSILALGTPEHKVFAWSTPLDIVGFTSNIYYRLAEIMPYNRATVRKIVGKLLGSELVNWKERQLKQIEEGLKARIDEQIERGVGWIPVGARATGKEEAVDGENNGSSHVRWHWTTISKHILYQYMVLVLNINELRNQPGETDGSGSNQGYREQQARKDAYAHLVNLWPTSSMSTYEISRAYSSRKVLVEKQAKKADKLSEQAPVREVPEEHETTPIPADPASAAAQNIPEQPRAGPSHGSAHPSSAHPSQQEAQQVYTSPVLMTSPTRERYGHYQSPVADDHTQIALRKSVMSEFDDSYSGRNAHLHPPSHRALDFGNQSSSLDQQVRTHVYSYYAGDANQQRQSQNQHQHQNQYQQRQGQTQQHSTADEVNINEGDDAGGENENQYSSPNSSRYSMSVKNLTSP